MTLGALPSPPRRPFSSWAPFWTVLALLATLVFLAASEEISPSSQDQLDHEQGVDEQTRAKRASRWERSSQRNQKTCSAENRGTCGPDEIARMIVIQAKRCLEYIDAFKEDFVQHVLSKSWNKANADEPPKLCDGVQGCPRASIVYQHEPYLAVVPTTVSSNPDFDVELRKAYSFLQHYSVALNHLLLDQEFFKDDEYMDDIRKISVGIEDFLCQLLSDITGRDLSPDTNTMLKLTHEIYRQQWISKLKEKRDFVFLRDTWAGLLYIRDTFSML